MRSIIKIVFFLGNIIQNPVYVMGSRGGSCFSTPIFFGIGSLDPADDNNTYVVKVNTPSDCNLPFSPVSVWGKRIC